jgi:hypothetical protein
MLIQSRARIEKSRKVNILEKKLGEERNELKGNRKKMIYLQQQIS